MIVHVDKNEPIKVKKVLINIGDVTYKITESVDGKMTINKSDLDEPLMIFPRYANEIEIL